jgi:hypothetical protein
MFDFDPDIMMPNIGYANEKNCEPTKCGYVIFPNQQQNEIYPLMEGLNMGTIYPELNMPMLDIDWSMYDNWKEEYK